MRPLHLALVWHMHQPYYKDDLTHTYLLPWVRLRAAKDYYKMAALLDDYPRVRQTFNLVPSLLAQIEDYTKGDYEDLFLNLARRPAADLTHEERRFLIRWTRESSRFLRVQVKSTQFFDHGCYPCAVRGSRWRYAENAFDFLAVYILPEDLWYIIPAHAFRGQASVALRPACETSKYTKYLGAWELLKKELESAPSSPELSHGG